jgi:hypothetical protein
VKIALALLLGIIPPWADCRHYEQEPNGSFPLATRAGAVPAMHRQAVCGEAIQGDLDCWEIHLDYQTSWFAEGAVSLELQGDAGWPLELAVYDMLPGGGWHFIDAWHSSGGVIRTGQVGVNYWQAGGLTSCFAVVTTPIGTPEYQLRFW